MYVFYYSIQKNTGKERGEKEGREIEIERERDERGQRVMKRSIGQIVFVRTPILRISPKFGLLRTKRN
jgi:hypothetical protein